MQTIVAIFFLTLTHLYNVKHTVHACFCCRCNGVQDCPKNDDEHRCAYCFDDEFACDNQRCIPQSWVCDKTDDCGDKSDEKDCGGNKWRNANVNTSNVCEEFKCAMGTCLPFSKVCDGIRDCPDNSDENGECSM